MAAYDKYSETKNGKPWGKKKLFITCEYWSGILFAIAHTIETKNKYNAYTSTSGYYMSMSFVYSVTLN
jgi:hypothetical protein